TIEAAVRGSRRARCRRTLPAWAHYPRPRATPGRSSPLRGPQVSSCDLDLAERKVAAGRDGAMTRIAHVLSTAQHRGAERFALELASAMSAAGHAGPTFALTAGGPPPLVNTTVLGS